jgi:hypothetical protein
MKIKFKKEKILFYIHNVDEYRDILLHRNILYSQLSFTVNMKKITLMQTQFQLIDCAKLYILRNFKMLLFWSFFSSFFIVLHND